MPSVVSMDHTHTVTCHKRPQGDAGCRIMMPTTTPKQVATSQEIIDELGKSKLKLHSRCLALFSKLTDAQTRIAELESIISAMRYAEKLIDLERCGLCETEAFASDA